jgi:hypothetical protein
MHRALLATLGVVALAGCSDMEKMMGRELEARLIACPATNTSIGDVPSCGKVWKLQSGEAELERDGDLEAEVKGLVLNDPSTGDANGTADGVDGIAAAVVCGGLTTGKVAVQTDVVPLSKDGNAKIKAKVSMPSNCTTPIIVLRERYQGKIGGWLATTKM